MVAKRFDRPRRALLAGFLALAALTLLAHVKRGELPGRDALRPELASAPVQEPTDRPPFRFDYRGRAIAVEPVAAYQLHGLVVSHNNIKSVADIYHDRSSVDTKDLCVIWGDNLTTDDYRRVEYWSGPFTCYVRWFENDIQFVGTALSNNHLLTTDRELRRRLAGVRIGDQVRLSGLLVNYQLDDWGDFWRRSSLVRDDDGDGACEVLFFERLEVLARATPGWYALFDLGRLGMVLLGLAWVCSFLLDARHSAAAARREPVFAGPPPEVYTGEVGERPY